MKYLKNKCPKCGSSKARLHYDEVLDVIESTCERCSYKFIQEPLKRDK